MRKPVDPERSMVNRSHEEHSTIMEVLVRIPYHPYDVSLRQIAKEMFKNEWKHHIIRDMIGRLNSAGYGIRTYLGPNKLPCVYIEDGLKVTRNEAMSRAKAYEARVYRTYHIPTPKSLPNYKNTMPEKKEKKFKSWPGYFKITHKSTKVVTSRSCESGYTDASKKKHNETLRKKKDVSNGNAVQDA